MAVKVIASIESIDYFDEGQQECGFRIRMLDGTHRPAEEALGPYSTALGGVAMASAIRTSVQGWAETNWETEFGMLDTVYLVGHG